MKVDLHAYGLIGFDDYWIKKQGYLNKNLLIEIYEIAQKRNLDLVSITSNEDIIQKGVYQDRFSKLLEYTKSLPKNYETYKIGESAIVLNRHGQKLTILNSIKLSIKENNRTIDHLVLGSNSIPTNFNFEDTLNYASDNGLIQISPTPFHPCFGIGEELLKKYHEKIDAIEIRNSRLAVGSIFCLIPALRGYCQNLDKKAEKIASKLKKPGLANSQAIFIKDIGSSYTDLPFELEIKKGQIELLSSVKKSFAHVNTNYPLIENNYISLKDFIIHKKLLHSIKTEKK